MPPVEEWCRCGHCQLMPTIEQNVCCQEHELTVNRVSEDIPCIIDHPGVFQHTREFVLESTYNSYLYDHGMLPSFTVLGIL